MRNISLLIAILTLSGCAKLYRPLNCDTYAAKGFKVEDIEPTSFASVYARNKSIASPMAVCVRIKASSPTEANLSNYQFEITTPSGEIVIQKLGTNETAPINVQSSITRDPFLGGLTNQTNSFESSECLDSPDFESYLEIKITNLITNQIAKAQVWKAGQFCLTKLVNKN